MRRRREVGDYGEATEGFQLAVPPRNRRVVGVMVFRADSARFQGTTEHR